MINILKLTDADVGREVKYEGVGGSTEFGRISAWNSRYVFVRYHRFRSANGEEHSRTGTTSEATRPVDLEFVS